MGDTSLFKSGMLIVVLQLVILSMSTLAWCGPLLTLPMGATSYLDLTTTPFKSGIPGLVLLCASPLRAYQLGVVYCLLSQWVSHHLWILQPHCSNLGLQKL